MPSWDPVDHVDDDWFSMIGRPGRCGTYVSSILSCVQATQNHCANEIALPYISIPLLSLITEAS